MSTPVRTISFAPRSISRATASRMASNASERPRPPPVDSADHGIPNGLERERAARPTCLPDRAESAAVVAACLDGDEALDLCEQAAWRHDVILRKAAELAGVSDHPRNTRHRF